MTNPPAFDPDSFSWLLGIEDTCVYPADGGAPLDEHELTGHTARWRADLTAARDTGATAVRYGMSWPLVHTAPGTFDWVSLDEIVDFAVDELGLDLVADLVHYGTPTWLTGSFADTGYPAAIEEFAGALAARYRGRICAYTPLNEPVTTASFCGLRGVWPPRLSGWYGWTTVVLPLAEGIVRATRAIRSADPDAVIVHVEAATWVHTTDEALTEHTALLRRIGWLPTDLILGAVDSNHPMYDWLLENGAAVDQLESLLRQSAAPDLIGVNYYPDLTPRRLVTVDGAPVQVAYNAGPAGLRSVLADFSNRYRLPLAVTETSIEGDDAARSAWLRESAAAVLDLRERGADIRGYTWWPLMDFVDWSYAAGGANVEEFAVALARDDDVAVGPAPPLGSPGDGKTPFLRRMGLLRLEEQADGSLDRVATPAVDAFRQVAMTMNSLAVTR
ncbi:MAG: family 1 glycosylhydrolase [Nakamurella sp.]